MNENHKPFIGIRHAAVRLGVPIAWLVSEAQAGRIPSLRAGKKIVVNVDDVRESLQMRAKGEVSHD